MKQPKLKKVLIWSLVILIVAFLGYQLLHGQNYLTRRSIRYTERFISSFGVWAPVIVVLLMLISTVVPPLPLPIPLIEIAAGLAFGFWEGAILVWFSQIVSSVVAFKLARFFDQKILGRALDNKIFNLYRQFIEKRGARAILLIRMAMAAPFNIISYLAGLTKMDSLKFIGASALGVIPEVVLFTFLGSQLRNVHLNLGHVVLIIIGIGALGSGLTFLTMKLVLPRLVSNKI